MKVKIRNSIIRLTYVLIDLICIYWAIYLVCYFRPQTLPFDISHQNLFFSYRNPSRFILVFWAVTTVMFLNARALYQTKREVLEGFEIWQIIKSVIYSALTVVVVLYGMRQQEFPRSVLIIGSGLIVVFLSIWRTLKRFFVEYLVSQGYNNFNALIIGAGRVGANLAQEIGKRN